MGAVFNRPFFMAANFDDTGLNNGAKATVLEFYQAFDDRNLDHALTMLAPNFVAHLAGVPTPLDTEGFKQFGLTFYQAFTNGHHAFEEVIIEGSKVVTCGTFTAIHTGSFQGLPPTGKSIRLAIMHIDRVEAGQIVEHWGQGDALGLMQQLGIAVVPGPALIWNILKNRISSGFRSSKTL